MIAGGPVAVFEPLFGQRGDNGDKRRRSLAVAEFSVRNRHPPASDVDDGVAGVLAAGGVVRVAGQQQRFIWVQGHNFRVEWPEVRRSMRRAAFLAGTVPSG